MRALYSNDDHQTLAEYDYINFVLSIQCFFALDNSTGVPWFGNLLF